MQTLTGGDRPHQPHYQKCVENYASCHQTSPTNILSGD
ncbi:hypothetical protein GXM_02337 [Nostoc sphaeroides CCNUC1]|uniref:Uncharacterized protein n=1 Tax=Nostoc sphaeroides CCNUC1 TaxID=2653204 RepID=A0A5P8VWS2_9NOSO|nr:hypothetical protein GXM_02337 [Nostoc sphaeroides CCNUC1]